MPKLSKSMFGNLKKVTDSSKAGNSFGRHKVGSSTAVENGFESANAFQLLN